MVDTGSADLWVPSIECPANKCPYARFDSAQSSTFKPTDIKFGIIYGGGSVNGTYATDTITIAGVSVENQQFGLASTTADIYTDQSDASGVPTLNGILGLGYPKLTAAHNAGGPDYNPFVFNLVEQKLISQPIFSIYMNKQAAEGWVGEIIFGGVDNSKFTGELLYVPVAVDTPKPNDQGKQPPQESIDTYMFWTVYGQGIAVETSQTITEIIAFDSAIPFITDTGSTITYLPKDVAYEVAQELVGENKFQLDQEIGAYTCDCNAGISGTSLQLQISTSNDVSSDAVLLSVPVSELLIPLDASSFQETSRCALGVAPAAKEHPQYLIGDAVLRSAYMVYDIGQNRIGFAAAQNVPGSVQMEANDGSNAPGGTPDL
ncbi:aspartic peptidase domain-containing protein [Fennellomyces sp. T-0311]|nr:aspartic peptidase domain-containing protein [Fennellomyces sp. T-0311]